MSRPPRLRSPFTPAAAAAGVALVGVAATAVATARGTRRSTPSRVQVPKGVATPDGLRLHTTIRGPKDADAAVVFAHGWTMSSEFWTATAEALSRKGLQTVTYDQRGHGRSGRPGSRGFELAHLGDDLAAVLDTTVDHDRPVLLVGHSMGAMSVMAWAGRNTPTNHRVVGTLLANTSMHGVVPDALAALTGTNNRAAHALLRQAAKVPTPIPATPINRSIVRMVALGPDASRSAVVMTERLFMDCPPATRVGFARQMDVLDLRHGVSRLDVPTLVLSGTNDRLTPPAHSEQIVSALPQGRLQVIPGAGHQLPIELTADTNDAVHDHLRRCLAAAEKSVAAGI